MYNKNTPHITNTSTVMTNAFNKSLKYKIPTKINTYRYSKQLFVEKILECNPVRFNNFINKHIDMEILRKKLGHVKINVKKGNYNDPKYGNYNKSFYKQHSYRSNVADFIDNVIYNDDIIRKNIPYAGNILFPVEYQRKLFNKEINIPFFKFRPAKFWISKKDTITKLHRDSADNIIIQLYGKKKWTIFPLQLSNYLYYSRSPSALSERSLVDIKNPNYTKYPLFRYCYNKRLEIVLKPGDMFFLPIGWAHEVETLSDSISINYWTLKPRTVYDIKNTSQNLVGYETFINYNPNYYYLRIIILLAFLLLIYQIKIGQNIK